MTDGRVVVLEPQFDNIGLGTIYNEYSTATILDGGWVNARKGYQIADTQVVDARKTGWGTPTGTANRAAFDTTTVTTNGLAERVKALIDDLTAHGLIGE